MCALMCVSVNKHRDEEERGKFNNFDLSRIGAKVKESMSQRDRS